MGQVLQIGARAFTKWAGYLLQRGSIVVAKWGRYCSVGQIYLQIWGNYYRRAKNIFMTLGQIETYVYRQGQCVFRTEFRGLLIFGKLSQTVSFNVSF